ncbi:MULTISPECIES: hypothetical protein [Roseobacteraceae]|uniref:hypothetical protein n=1 Tax=Roseobacteraceae TaxID=2854170 RepID=UPI002B267CD1|nr:MULTISPECIES: hypothetical protein [Roseobacteraceae]
MFDIPQPATALHRFAEDHHEAIQNAALLLGGRPWLRRAQRWLADLEQPQPVTRRLIGETVALLSLLALENVHDQDRPEAGCFASLDPAAPYVEEICLLHDALSDAIRKMDAQEPSPFSTGMKEQIDD